MMDDLLRHDARMTLPAMAERDMLRTGLRRHMQHEAIVGHAWCRTQPIENAVVDRHVGAGI